MVLEIIAPDKNVYSGTVNYIELPGINGLFGVLKDHAPLISALGKGSILITEEGGKELSFDIKGGVVEISNNKAVILAD